MKRAFFLTLILSLFPLSAFTCCDKLADNLIESRLYTQDTQAIKEMLHNKERLLQQATTEEAREPLALMVLYLKMRLGRATADDVKILDKTDNCNLLMKPILILVFPDQMKELGFNTDPQSVLDLYETHAKAIASCYYPLLVKCRAQNMVQPEEKNPACMDADRVFMTHDKVLFRRHVAFRKFLTTALNIKPRMNIKYEQNKGKFRDKKQRLKFKENTTKEPAQ